MKIVLVSRDQILARSCREILNELPGSDTFLVVEAAATGVVPPHDLCLWDFVAEETAGLSELSGLTSSSLQRCFFLTQKRYLPILQELTGTSDLQVLLKPVTPATLRAVLGEACRLWREQYENAAAHIGTLRAERDEMLQCLLQANLRLQEYDQERTNFLARSIHDFRAPLTALTGYCSLLLEEQLGAITSVQREILERMQRSARRLSRMANGMFQLSVAGRAEQTLRLCEGDLRDCVEQALHEVTPFLEGKRIAVTTEIVDSANLFFERSLMEQMLINLLDNACKFTPRAGIIEIKGYPFFWERRAGLVGRFDIARDRRTAPVHTPNCFRLDIRDSGPEIPAGHLNKIFEEYTSYAGGQDRSGGGLGLAICKMIAQRHQGRVWAENSSVGPVFSMVLPFQQLQDRMPVAAAGAEVFSCAV